MASTGTDDLLAALKVISTVSTGVNAGISWFILYGSTPAAMSLRASCLLKVTKSLIPRCGPMPVTLATSALGATGVYLMTSSLQKNRGGWIAVAGLMGGLLPYSFYFMLPINVKVMKDEIKEEDAHDVMTKWWNYHFIRTLVSSGCFAYVSYKLIKH